MQCMQGNFIYLASRRVSQAPAAPIEEAQKSVQKHHVAELRKNASHERCKRYVCSHKLGSHAEQITYHVKAEDQEQDWPTSDSYMLLEFSFHSCIHNTCQFTQQQRIDRGSELLQHSSQTCLHLGN